VVTARPGDTSEELAARMASGGDKLALFRMINNLAPGEALSAGRQVKLVVDQRR
jgi:predicted Zn-dependent protease